MITDTVSATSVDAWETVGGGHIYLAYMPVLDGYVYGIAIRPSCRDGLPTSHEYEGVSYPIIWERVNFQTARTFREIQLSNPSYPVPKELLPLKANRLKLITK